MLSMGHERCIGGRCALRLRVFWREALLPGCFVRVATILCILGERGRRWIWRFVLGTNHDAMLELHGRRTLRGRVRSSSRGSGNAFGARLTCDRAFFCVFKATVWTEMTLPTPSDGRADLMG